MPGALTFGGATSDRVQVTATASINNLANLSYIFWIFPTTLTASRQVLTKGGGGGGIYLSLDGTGGNVEWSVECVTNAGIIVTTDTPLSALNTWVCMMVTWAFSTKTLLAFSGTTVANFAQRTFTTPLTAAGAQGDDSAQDFRWGNHNGNNLAIQARIGPCAIFGATLVLADGKNWMRLPRKTLGANVAKGFWRNGKNGADAIEYVGVGGTVTGATQSNGPPIRQNYVRHGSFLLPTG